MTPNRAMVAAVPHWMTPAAAEIIIVRDRVWPPVPGAIVLSKGYPGVQGRHIPRTRSQALYRRQAFKVSLDGEHRIDPTDSVDRQRRLGQVGQLEQIATTMCPTGGLSDRAWLARRIVEIGISGISISLEDASISGEVSSGMISAAIS